MLLRIVVCKTLANAGKSTSAVLIFCCYKRAKNITYRVVIEIV